jgi:hypothetical protein
MHGCFDSLEFPLDGRVALQGSCAEGCIQRKSCLACSQALDASMLTQVSSSTHLKEKARRLALCDTDTLMAAASNALAFWDYQQQLIAAKDRQTGKAQLKDFLEKSKKKMMELQSAAQKVLHVASFEHCSCC